MNRYLMLVQSLPDGKYKVPGKLKWHERLRIKLAYMLFKSVPMPYDMEIKTSSY